MKRFRLIIFLCLQPMALLWAEPEPGSKTPTEVDGFRSWTNKEGNEIEASLVRVFNKKEDGEKLLQVTFKLKAGKEWRHG